MGPRANGVYWRVNDPTLVVIILGENGDPTGRGRDMWILSHLTYPLTWVLETFQMFKVGREGYGEVMEDMLSTDEVFSRVAGHVDINLRKNKIMFIVPTKTRSTVEVGEAIFNITSTDRYRQMAVRPAPHVQHGCPHRRHGRRVYVLAS